MFKRKACEKYKLNIVRGIIYCTQTQNILSPSDWAAVTFVCKHMNNLKHLQLYIRRLRKMIVFWKSVNYYNKDVSKVWCWCMSIYQFETSGSGLAQKQLISALMKSKCTNHEHNKLVHLRLSIIMTDECVSSIYVHLLRTDMDFLKLR
jgi:hypothetical protein